MSLSSLPAVQPARRAFNFPHLNRPQRALLFGLIALLTFLPIFYLAADTVMSVREETYGETQLYFATSHSRVLYPHQCIDLIWKVEGVKTVQINTVGRVGEGTQKICNSFHRPSVLRAELPDGSVKEIRIWVQQLYQQPLVLALEIVALIALALMVYNLIGVPGTLIMLAIVFTWPSMNYFVYSTLTQFTDYIGHINITRGIIDGSRSLPPHFLYHVLTIGLINLFPGLRLDDANFLILVASNIATCLLVYTLLRVVVGTRADTNWKWTLFYLAVPLILFVGPINFDAPFVLLSAYVYPNTPHNPTVNFLRPFALGIILCLILLLNRITNRRGVVVAAMAVLTILATLAKPSFTLPLLPAACLIVAFTFLRPLLLKRWEIVAGIIIPAVLVLGWQYLITYGPEQAKLYASDEKAGLVLAPFDLYVTYWEIPAEQLLPQFLVSLLFPMVVYVIYFREALKDIALNIAWLVFLGGQSMAYLFIEVPARRDGNMTWSGRITLFILFVVTLAFFIRQNKVLFEKGAFILRDWRFLLGTLLLVLHILPNLVALWG